MKHITNLFGVSEQELAKEGPEMNGETCIWPMYFVKQCMKKFAAKNKWTELRDLIIATIFGFVLFSTYKNSICHKALDVYFKMMNEGRNPIPTILTDTFIALNQCRRSGKGKHKCCYQLFFLEKKASMKLSRQQWLTKFGEVNSGNVYWHIPCTFRCGIVVSCGNFSFIPLFRTRGYISYSPLMVFQQYKMR
ncbi:hypothetical protein L6164_037438 [Bauhinia variegata]|uniref:Uncharacterized protein n=1 Tax=Bauhinia variegata TaxID=167791 RepID=A0ACB9KK39_BAUVA|nr:hypothetical protein L6164_037438 [Bauhinia variegata]